MFDVLVLGLWTVAGWGLHRAVRVLRRRAAPPRRLSAGGGVLVRAVLVAALLVMPIWAGFGWSGLRVWAPDLWLVLLVLIALLTATAAVRLAGLARPHPAEPAAALTDRTRPGEPQAAAAVTVPVGAVVNPMIHDLPPHRLRSVPRARCGRAGQPGTHERCRPSTPHARYGPPGAPTSGPKGVVDRWPRQLPVGRAVAEAGLCRPPDVQLCRICPGFAARRCPATGAGSRAAVRL
jgi:hypothetical protein